MSKPITPRRLSLARKWLRNGLTLSEAAQNISVKQTELDIALWNDLPAAKAKAA